MGAAPLALAVAAVLAAGPAPSSASPAPATTPHHVLVLDDSGSMELQFDVHGYGLAVPELFRRVLGERALSVFLLPQGSPDGDVPRLAPGDFLTYARRNGTAYAGAMRAAVREAERVMQAEPGRPVEVLLVTDAEPDDADARAVIDQALARHPQLAFACVLLATSAEGDLCRGRATAVPDGFAMAQVLATDLGRGLGSVPRWGRLGPAAREATVPLGRFVRRAHVLFLGARAGEDFAAEVALGPDARAVDVAHTRPLLPADMVRAQALAQGLGMAPGGLPVGPSPELALGTVTVERASGAAGDLTLRLRRADGEVAWGVLLEYDLAAALTAPATVDVGPTGARFTARAELTHAGAHVDDAAALAALGLAGSLVVTPVCVAPAPCPAARTVPIAMDAQGMADASIEVEDGVESYRLEARFASATADLRAPPVVTVVRRAATTVATPIPPVPPPVVATGPPPALAPAPPSTPAPPPTAAPTPAPSTRITQWIPPVLDLPDFQIEGTELGYALSVTSFQGKALTGAEIAAAKLQAALVVDGRELPMRLVGDRFEARFPVGSPGAREVKVRLLTPEGPLDSNADRMDVLPDARVRLAPTTDVGSVEAGCDATDRCVALDASGSLRLDGLGLVATRRAGTAPDATVTLRRGDDTWPLARDTPVELPATAAPAAGLEVCIAPPGCSDAPADAAELVDLAPADPRLQTGDRVARTRVVASVVPSTWLACNLWWVVLVVTGLFIGFVAYGYVRPRAFPLGAVVHVASGGDGERRLARDPGRPLRAVPHGRRGFYRTATCAFDPSGFTVKKSKPHVVMLRADRGGQIALVARGAAVERRTRGAWVPIDRAAERYLLSGATYRINGSFFFKVLA